MASPPSATTVLLLPLLILSIFAISATARPCKTIFFITSSSSSNFQNPNSNSPHRLTFFITEIHRTTSSFPIHHHQNDVVKPQQPSSSIRDRTIDIMTIVGALLFGVGCGALTAATMYFIWSLLSNTPLHEDDDYVSDDSSDGDDDVINKNKTSDGYVSVPVKQIPPTADEIDAMI